MTELSDTETHNFAVGLLSRSCERQIDDHGKKCALDLDSSVC